ncbi:ABC transporter permease [Roseivirga sp. E12]|uniref:ABC transporter permease n=1 Tax=Roseivirga sp. E12 TaxID=2819237 RepID=UPI001ABBF640|nr:ABC transporter permease [Roseivirga sp. E12]MBO3700661.1 ABC transporter permease [Roseivirga sp. E12]
MIRNHLILALRRLKKDKFFSFLNITGLTVGVASFILLMLYAQFELSFDKFHEKADEIYVLADEYHTRNGKERSERYRTTYAALLKQNIPELGKMAMVGGAGANYLVKIGGSSFYEDQVLMTNDEFFEVFDFDLVIGDNDLNTPKKAVISQSIAKKYFGEENPIGAVLELFKTELVGQFQITGVVADPPKNSHIQFSILLSNVDDITDALGRLGENGGSVTANYVLIPKGSDFKEIDKKVETFILENWPEEQIRKNDEGELMGKPFLFPYTDIHLKSDFGWALFPVSDITYVYLFSIIAILILAIACFNYINLVTARSVKKLKEIGVRKVLGAQKRQIIRQNMVESFLFTFISVFLAFAIAERVIPFYNQLIERELSLSYWSLEFFAFVFGLSLLVSFAAGYYPAFKLSRFKAISALAGGKNAKGKSGFRRGLVFFQFLIAQLLIVATLIIQSQLSYIQNKNLGYDREQLVYINTYGELRNNVDVFKSKLEQIPNIRALSVSDGIFNKNGITFFSSQEIYGPETDKKGYVVVDILNVDSAFMSTTGMEMLLGDPFHRLGAQGPTTAMVINEACQKKFGWENPLGQQMEVWGAQRTVVGVVKDFHNESLKANVKPAMLVLDDDVHSFVSLKLVGVDVSNTMKQIESTWNSMVEDRPLTFQFYDDYYDSQYRKEMRLGQIFNVFSSIAIFISILGLIGLTAYSAEQRLKEFGIRKVLGAKVKQVMFLLSKEFVILIALAFLVASPIVYYGINSWLEQFAYRIDLGPEIFAFGLLATLSISLLAVANQALKVSKVNPTEILRNE